MNYNDMTPDEKIEALVKSNHHLGLQILQLRRGLTEALDLLDDSETIEHETYDQLLTVINSALYGDW